MYPEFTLTIFQSDQSDQTEQKNKGKKIKEKTIEAKKVDENFQTD